MSEVHTSKAAAQSGDLEELWKLRARFERSFELQQTQGPKDRRKQYTRQCL